MEMSEPVDPSKVFSKLSQLGEPQKQSGSVMVRGTQRKNEPSIAFVDDRTIVFALDEKLDRLLTAAAVDSRLARLLASYDGKAHAFAVIDLEAVREPLAMLKPMAAQAPPQFQEFFKLPDLLTAIELKLAITGSTTAELVLHAHDEPSAAEAERLVNHALQIAREMALASIARNRCGPELRATTSHRPLAPPHFREGGPSLGPTRDRTRVTITASVDSGYAGVAILPALLLPAINTAPEAAAAINQ